MNTRRFRIADDAIPGAHAQFWVAADANADPSRVAVRREEDGPNGALALLPKEWLVEVKPPSIDDPVELPLTLVDDVADRTVRLVPSDVTNYPAHLRLRLRKEHVDQDGTYYASAVFEPTKEQCLDLARALWLLGTREASS